MNQRADSLKKNLQPNVAKPRFNHCGRLLSHSLAHHQGEKRENRIESGGCGKIEAGPHPSHRSRRSRCAFPPHKVGGIRKSVTSSRGADQRSAPVFILLDGMQQRSRSNLEPRLSRDQSSSLLDFRRFASGLMLIGLPATGVSSGSGLTKARHAGLSCDLFLTMQTVTRSMSGISEPQTRNASPLHACSCSCV